MNVIPMRRNDDLPEGGHPLERLKAFRRIIPRDLAATERDLLTVLFLFANADGGGIYASQPTLREHARASHGALNRALLKLKQRGHLLDDGWHQVTATTKTRMRRIDFAALRRDAEASPNSRKLTPTRGRVQTPTCGTVQVPTDGTGQTPMHAQSAVPWVGHNLPLDLPVTDSQGQQRRSGQDDAVEEAVEVWNATCGDLCGRPRKITGTRRRRFLAALKEVGGPEGWRGVCERVAASPFLTGAGDRGWKADIDFVIRPEKLLKIAEGGFDPRRPAAPTAPNGEPLVWGGL